MSKASLAEAAYQFRVWLRGISPTIWRRFVVRGDSTIADLRYYWNPNSSSSAFASCKSFVSKPSVNQL